MKFNWHFVGYGLLALVLAGLALAYEGAQRDKIRSDAVQAANSILIKQADDRVQKSQQQVNDLLAAWKQSEADKAALQEQINKKFQQIRTPQQAATTTAQSLGVPPSEVKTGGTPEKPTLEVPQGPALVYQQACETCQLNFKVATQQLGYSEQIRQQQVDALSAKDQKIGALSRDLDSANKAVKGGSWLRRSWNAAKYLIIGAGAGAAVLCGSGHCR